MAARQFFSSTEDASVEPRKVILTVKDQFPLCRIGIPAIRGYLFSEDVMFLLKIFRSRDSSVAIATGYGLDDQGRREFESR
jgi:hypothetical protein